ncbi:MAG: putative molybdenum cofactor guanylyltransferase [Firmicutes bacterium]|nr:putative molybdenum cofactor guanylyltransferase [Bacillota bacterium]
MANDLFGSAIILAGGKSSRMGFGKEHMEIAGTRLLCGLADQLRQVFPEVLVASSLLSSEDNCGCPVVPDTFPSLGPLGGLHAALKQAQSQFVYVLACDMPNINLPYVTYMANLIRTAAVPPAAVVTSSADGIEPLNAFYSKALLAIIESNINAGRRSFVAVLADSNALVVEESIARQFSPDWQMFFNINTPTDYAFFEALCQTKRARA